MDRFRGKVVIVTGAARGMGKACASAFLKEGGKVFLNDIDGETLSETVGELHGAGKDAYPFVGDISKKGIAISLVETALERLGTVDVLVNNVGILRTTKLESIEESEWDEVLAVNVKSFFLMTKAVLPVMREKGYGKIVNVSSSAGRSTSELGGAHYTASKAAVLGLSRHAAREMAPFGVNVNAVCPGLIDTPMIHERSSQGRLEAWRNHIPFGRFGQPWEEADLVLFLASDEASYITGATIDINGGSLMM